MISRVLSALGITLMMSTASVAKREPKGAWATSQVRDPITDEQTCVVAASDYFGKFNYTRAGHLYPIVENNSRLGLLVGVSSGGPYRFPTGDIVWRVDDRPHRELKAQDNPEEKSSLLPTYETGNPETDERIRDAMTASSKMIRAATSTSTVAQGDMAREMLRKMLAGRSLLYRAAGAAPAYGLPSQGTWRVGQVTNDGWRPIPLDQSFRDGLLRCGIDPANP